MTGEKRRRKLPLLLAWSLVALALVSVATLLLQGGWSHREQAYRPPGSPKELAQLLDKPVLSREDQQLLLYETGLSPAAVEELRSQGEAGKQTILEIQAGFHETPEATCVPLIGGGFTCEDLLLDEEGERIAAVPLAPLHPGDILVSFATHSMGWRHGHAGLVVEPDRVLEAVQIGMNSYRAPVRHWQSYANFAVLRVKDATAELGRRVAEFACRYLDDIPYSLLPGITCPKTAAVEALPGVHCAFLPWYAWKQQGVDLDESGGRIVTVGDLARSDRLEVVQVYGVDPREVEDRLCE